MAAEQLYVKLWLSYDKYFEPLGAAEVGRLVLAMMEYKSTGTEPKLDGNERFVWPAVKRDIDASNESYAKISERNVQNGAKGGRPKKSAKSEDNPKNPVGFTKPKKPRKR